MTQLIHAPVSERPVAEDPFRYGYRDVPRKQPDGGVTYERMPLTLEDLLHPQENDKPVASSIHDLDRGYLANVSRARTAPDPEALVLSDTSVYWDDPTLKHHNPDVTLIFGLRRRRPVWTSFFVSTEGVRPRMLIEVVSPDYRKNDVETKLEQYHQARVPWYIIVDREQDEGPPQLLGYRYTPAKYEKLPLDHQGRLWLEPLGVWLGVQGNRVVCYDGKTGEVIGDYTQVSQALDATQARASAAEQRAEAAKQAADTEKQRADAEKQRAEAEKQRADAAKHAAELEKQRAEAAKHAADQAEQRAAAEQEARALAEARLRELEAELHRLRGET